MIAFASSLDQAGPLTRDVARRGADALAHGRPGPLRRDLAARSRRRSRCRRAERLDGVRLGVPAELTGEGDRSRACKEALRRGARERPRSSARSSLEVAAAARAARARRLLRARARRVLLEPRALRRRSLRPARRRARTTCSTCTRAPATTASAPEVKRRMMLGTYALSSGYYDAYYGRAQRVRTKIAEDFASGLRAGRLHRHARPRRPSPSRSGEKTGDPLAMYLNDYCTVPMSLAGIPAISIPCGLSERPARRPAARRARPSARTRLLDAAHALERALGFDGSAAPCLSSRR